MYKSLNEFEIRGSKVSLTRIPVELSSVYLVVCLAVCL